MTTGELLLSIGLFLLGFVALIFGGDWFVDGASGIARKLRIPELIIGATIVSIGTTLPEVIVSSGAAVAGNGATSYGNAIGSIICNTALISALTVAIKPGKVDRKKFILPVIFFFGSAAFYAFNAYAFGKFERWAGIVLLTIFVVYMAYTLITETRESKKKTLEAEDKKDDEEEEMKPTPLWKDILFLVIGAAFIAVGAYLLIQEGPKIAKHFGVPESVIALVFVALGTSLPELVTAIVSLVKGHGALSLGNIIGANLFNLVLVSGLSVTLAPYALPAEKTIGGMNAALLVDTPLMALVMAILTIPTLISGKLRRWQGISLLALYAAYLVFQFVF